MILWRSIENFLFFIIFIPTPDFPHFHYMLGGNLGSLLYGDVSVMYVIFYRSQVSISFENNIIVFMFSFYPKVLHFFVFILSKFSEFILFKLFKIVWL